MDAAVPDAAAGAARRKSGPRQRGNDAILFGASVQSSAMELDAGGTVASGHRRRTETKGKRHLGVV